MTTQNYYEGVKHVVHISSDIGTACEHCGEKVGIERFAESINHYIDQHGYKLLHVGAQAIHDDQGKPCHCTVAVLGK